ncbi:MAG: peptide chain release factor N(5)-glutamine methyltransferase [Actinomycetota bacterium]
MRDLLREARTRLDRAGVDPSDAERLARGLLAEGVVLELLDDAPHGFEGAFRAAVARRAAREPLQLVLGRVGFRDLVLWTSPGVFIPRVETELVSGVAIDAACAAIAYRGSARVADLCTGSGAIAAALASEVAGVAVWAVELDPRALDLAARNLAGLGVSLVAGDAATALTDLDGTLDVVVANPPYVPPDGVPRDPEVRDWDPPLALYGGGHDGLEVPRAIMRRAAGLLRPGGVFVMEHADVQGEVVRAELETLGAFEDVATLPDLAGRDRMVRATRLGRAPEVGDWQT